MRSRFWLMMPVIALASFALATVLRSTGNLQLLERAGADAGARLMQHVVDSDIVIVSIDAASLAQLNQWPWPRRWHARVLETIRQGKPSHVFYDVDFSSESTPEDDRALTAELASWSNPAVVLPAFWQWSGDTSELIFTRPMAPLSRYADLASVNLQPDSDGLIRSVRSSWHIDGVDMPSVLMRMTEVPVPSDTELLLDMTIAPSSFQHFSFVDVLEGRIDPSRFRNKTVFIGATAVELGDMLAVPVHKSLPGVVVQALASESIRPEPLQPVSTGVTLTLLGLWACVVSWIYCLTSWRGGIFVFLVSASIATGCSVFFYIEYRTVLEFMPYVVSSMSGFLLATFTMLDDQQLKLLTTRLGLRKRDALLQSVFETSTDSIICMDADGVIQTANSAAGTLFRCDSETLCDAQITTLIPELCGEIILGDTVDFNALIGSVYEHDIRAREGSCIPTELSISRVHFKEETLFTVMLRDVSSRKKQEHELRFQATHDSLTQLPNRTALAAHLMARLGQGNRPPPVALLMLDLDRFKEVNDTLGHGTGDRVLCDVARRFETEVGVGGFVARIGGDEFAVVLDSARGRDGPAKIASRLVEGMKEPLNARGLSVELGLSIGIAYFPTDAADAESLLKHADIAMYLAKQNGTGFEFYDAAKDRNSVRKLSLVAQLRTAIARDELNLCYQPKVDLGSRQVHGAEALLRWEHPKLGCMNPEEFISLVEATELIRPLTEWTLQTGFCQIRALRDAGVEGPVAINLSARLLQDRNFPAHLQSMIRDANVSAGDLELEITESAMMMDPERAVGIIESIHELGVHISIDDFGTGYSSLVYLRDLPLQALKIDKSFVMSMRQREDNRVIVDSTVQMAHALGLSVVAEGVESAWEENHLVTAGCDMAQGFLYSKALPSSGFVQWCIDFNAVTQYREKVLPCR